MGRRCCVVGCSSTSRLPEHHGVTYHSFPLDAAIRSVWLRNCRLNANKQITKSVLVCSRHFRRIDFQPQRNGKYLLKQRVFPTVFAWGKIDPGQVVRDQEQLNNTGATSSGSNDFAPLDANLEDATKASVEAKVAQIMAETAELNAAAGLKTMKSGEIAEGGTSSTRYEPVSNFNPSARLEAQDFDGLWHSARIVEVDNEDREVLIKFERNGKNKSALAGTEEWIPMNSTRLRQKVSTKPIAIFQLEEKCLARWSGPRKFPGTVKKVLGNDTYEVLFDDGFVKNVRAMHMSKKISEPSTTTNLQPTPAATAKNTQAESPSPMEPVRRESMTNEKPDSIAKKRMSPGSRKDWPLLDLSKLDLASLNLPTIPRDGEWTCHWVNDQPIGKEGYLLVGEHKKPTVVVDDWRLPVGWVKHMYQRSNVLGKWDVILVSPNGKRFRSKSDLKTFLEEQGQVYNPDIYDFSIHRRRAKDINAYVFTPDYQPHQPIKSKSLNTSNDMATDSAFSLNDTLPLSVHSNNSSFMEAPIATPLPPMELMTPTSAPGHLKSLSNIANIATPQVSPCNNETTPSVANLQTSKESQSMGNLDPGIAYIGGLKVQIVDNLFQCPKEGCSKTFRKENHVQIHVKHYHPELKKLLGSCPKMMELAKKRTHTNSTESQSDTHAKNQIPNQEFFSKLYEQDILQHSRSSRQKSTNAQANPLNLLPAKETKTESVNAFKEEVISMEIPSTSSKAVPQLLKEKTETFPAYLSDADTSVISDLNSPPINSTPVDTEITANLHSRGPRRIFGARKSNRQRTTRRYLTSTQTRRAIRRIPTQSYNRTNESTLGISDFEETRHSFNATPDPKSLEENRKRKIPSSVTNIQPLGTQLSSDSPITADSGSSSMQLLSESDPNKWTFSQQQAQQQYIKENGELIKIVRMRQEEIINCVCQFGEEDGLMIQCELCLCWQHGACHGIEKESEVPEKYVCYICRNPERGRSSMRYKHDQDWLFDGVLPVANYHTSNPNISKRFEILRRSHTLAGNLVETKNFLHSLRVKINIASNRLHPKLYLWAKKWEADQNDKNMLSKFEADTDTKSNFTSPSKKAKIENDNKIPIMPNIPQPEAPIDPVECQQRLLAHIKVQQDLVMNRLLSIENEIDDLESHDDLHELKDADGGVAKDVLVTFIKELEIMHEIAKINQYENAFKDGQDQTLFPVGN